MDKFGREFLGHPDNSRYVLPKQEMDALLKKTSNNIDQIELELGIPKGVWHDKELIRIDLQKPGDLGLRMPSGNEGGANDLWLPGGKTTKGWSEAVINKVPKRNYIERGIK